MKTSKYNSLAKGVLNGFREVIEEGFILLHFSIYSTWAFTQDTLCSVCIFLISGLCAHAPDGYLWRERHVSVFFQCHHFQHNLKTVCQVTTAEVLKSMKSVSFWCVPPRNCPVRTAYKN